MRTVPNTTSSMNLMTIVAEARPSAMTVMMKRCVIS